MKVRHIMWQIALHLQQKVSKLIHESQRLHLT